MRPTRTPRTTDHRRLERAVVPGSKTATSQDRFRVNRRADGA
ncbi:hypothetical protein NJ7G_0596 [Natrinema sp. J7-2]|nr:hypothetical protein NJ7G_0596 [Natrinema sp. J7-2]